MSQTDYNSKEKEIIQLLGGTRNILKIILQNKTNLSHLQLSNLCHILKRKNDDINTVHDPPHDSDENTVHKPIEMTDLSEDCLAYIYKFLQRDEQQNLSETARYLHIVSYSKNCVPFPIQATCITYRLYHFINALCKLQATPNDTSVIPTIDALFCWVKTVCDVSDELILAKRKEILCKVLCRSGLLPLLIAQTMEVENDANTIKNILFVMNIICKYRLYAHIAVNADVIEHLVLLFDHPQMFELFPAICTLLHTLWGVNSDLYTGIQPRIFDVSLIRHIICALSLPWPRYRPTLSVLFKAVSFVRHWLLDGNDAVDGYDDIKRDFTYICASVVTYTEGLVNVMDSTKWILELEDGATVLIREDVDDVDDVDYTSAFQIKRILEIPTNNDLDGTCTFLGTFIPLDDLTKETTLHYQRPYLQITVPLRDLRCKSFSDEKHVPMFDDMMKPLSEIIEWISWRNRAEIEGMGKMIQGIKNIFITCQNQCPWFSLKDFILPLLHSNGLFWDIFCQQIEAEFTSDVLYNNVIVLLEAAALCYDSNQDRVDALCKSNWFRQRICELETYSLESYRGEFKVPSLCILLKYYHRDVEAYIPLTRYMNGVTASFWSDEKKVSISHIECFEKRNGISYLLAMVQHAYGNPNWTDRLDHHRWLLDVCQQILAHACFHLKNYEPLRKFGMELGVSNVWWWQVLQKAMLQNKHGAHVHTKTIVLIHEMDLFIRTQNIDALWFASNIDDMQLEMLSEVLTVKQDTVGAIHASAVQNILSMI
eukprot:216086_1